MTALDPVLVWTLRLSLALLFAAAVRAKLQARDEFVAAVRAYRLAPAELAAPLAAALLAAEAAAAALLA
ncbi:MAG TPA: MauE/DoxX family redox-associated membrane protein, partial [Candidatus Limnocylindria bacterium]|nr:MauE/DoxX family redox-associated membrane protein [Candidatus Limnocylindria bacterium]